MNVKPISFKMIQLYLLSMLFFTANSVLTVIFPLQAEHYGFKTSEIGIMMGLYMFVCMFLRPFAGQMIAKYGVKKVMWTLLIVHALALVLYVWLEVDSLYAVRSLQGVVTAFFSMSMQIGITDILRDKDRGQGMAMYSLSTVLPGLYGPALALYLWSDMQAIYVLVIILALLPLLLQFRTPFEETKIEFKPFSLKLVKESFFSAPNKLLSQKWLITSRLCRMVIL
ncbi:MFS transporter [Peribacillus asahii]|uniref:MFS transporter n=2 Tax=Peribacillus asahii TaxID=228899 RepID=A0A3T0KTR8_9BACI|nr:MFS transporter [Peribacillus asahii]